MKLTDEQEAVRDAVAGLVPGDTLKVIAFAGAGKTSTLTVAAGARADRGLYLAFNKAIAEEAQAKLRASRCRALTLHGLAYGALRDVVGRPESITPRLCRDSGVVYRHPAPRIEGWNTHRHAAAICRAVSLYCHSDDEEVTAEHAREAMIQAVGDPDRMTGREMKLRTQATIDAAVPGVTEAARELMVHCVTERIYSHDLYLKMLDIDETVRAEAFRGARYLLVDEAQDLSPVQRSILTRTGLPLVAVGDPRQQIYGWRGAENALALLPGAELLLTRSWRFGEDIAKIARILLASHPDGPPAGRLVGGGPGPARDDGPIGAVICRSNVTMLDEAMGVIENGWRVHVDRIDSIAEDIRSAAALKRGDIDGVVSAEVRQYGAWEELVAAGEMGDPGAARLVRYVEDNRQEQVDALAARCVALQGAQVIICTGHRAKGLEFPRVRLAGDWRDIEALKWGHAQAAKVSPRRAGLAAEEFNLVYVAATRAMRELSGWRRLFQPTERRPEPETAEPG